MSGGGVGFRFNNFLIDGVPQRSISGSQPPEFAGGKTLPFEAVAEYQLLVAPFDVAYGDFAGALVNTVTRSGTNQLEGSVFAYGRSDDLARRDALTAGTTYERLQYGLSLGGPIRRDRAHFFATAELQHLTAPAAGPYVGQPATATPPAPVSEADLARLSDIMRAHGLVAGSGGPVETRNPLTNVFTRVDLALPRFDSRLIVSANYGRSKSLGFSRPARGAFPLSTFSATQGNRTWTAALQLHTALRRHAGGHNQFLLSYGAGSFGASPNVRQPIVNVRVPATTGGAVTIMTGTPQLAHGGDFRPFSSNINVRDDLTVPLGTSHVVRLGVEAQWFRVEPQAVLNSYGTWIFSSLDALEAGVAERFEVRRDFGGVEAPISGGQYGAYVNDQWRVGEKVSISMGVRADVLTIDERAPYNPVVDSIFQRRTDEMPRARLHVSPRLGFTWDVFGTGRDVVRGGAGIFTGRPPVHWLRSALSSYGVGIGVLRCGPSPTESGPAPPFVPDYRQAPTTCANGSGLAATPRGDVDLLSRSLRMAQTLRGSLAYDRRLPWDLRATGEVLMTRNISDFVFVNLNLVGPQGMDRNGRVLYGTIGPNGLSVPALRSDFSEVIDLRSTSRNHSYLLSTRLEKPFSRGLAAMASYTFSHVRDAQTPLRTGTPGIVNWSSRSVSGRHEDLGPEISLNDIPHRVVLAGTYEAPWKPWRTILSFYYVGESGGPFTYLAFGGGRRGDLNADGSNANDPIYVPRDALDSDEIAFTGLSNTPGADNSSAAQAERVDEQRAAFERFIDRTGCLRRWRGRILERNGCREPWSHTTILSVRQAIPIGGHALEAELDVFNVLNLLNEDWGVYRVAAPALLEHVAQGPGSPETAQPIFRYDPTRLEWTTLPTESAFQLQLALRYSF
jgi:hypothetical protein